MHISIRPSISTPSGHHSDYISPFYFQISFRFLIDAVQFTHGMAQRQEVMFVGWIRQTEHALRVILEADLSAAYGRLGEWQGNSDHGEFLPGVFAGAPFEAGVGGCG